MFKKLYENKKFQYSFALFLGICFGFFLQKGGLTRFNTIVGQLLLKDFTVVKVMVTAIIVGSIGIHLLKSLNLTDLHVKGGSVGSTVIGGLIFGCGFAILGYCPGTIAGAIGTGSLDALVGGLGGIIVGSGIFANLYPFLKERVLERGKWKALTFPELLKVNPWVVVVPVLGALGAVLWFLESMGL